MEKQILVDMDGVLADVYSQYINYEFKNTGTLLHRKNWKGSPNFPFLLFEIT